MSLTATASVRYRVEAPAASGTVTGSSVAGVDPIAGFAAVWPGGVTTTFAMPAVVTWLQPISLASGFCDVSDDNV